MNIHWPCCCTVHAYAVIILWQYVVFLSGSESVHIIYKCLVVWYPTSKIGGLGISNVQDWWVRDIQCPRLVGSDDRIPLFYSTTSHFVFCSKQEPGFPTPSVVVFIYGQWVKVRGNCSFCWYWWRCWPPLYKLFIADK